jgi:hypothetical protein
MVLDWNQVKGAAEAAFAVWEDGGELLWAKDVWERAVAAGIAAYINEIKRHRVAILFLGLGGLYRDFCSLAWDEADEPTYSCWAETLELDHFVLGQLIGSDPCVEESDALNHLLNAARPQVMELLMRLFGDKNSLFVSLCNAGPKIWDEDHETCEGSPTDEEILNDVTPEKLAAYSWLESGADVLLDPF